MGGNFYLSRGWGVLQGYGVRRGEGVLAYVRPGGGGVLLLEDPIFLLASMLYVKNIKAFKRITYYLISIRI